ncbi:MAG: type II toxin-antitoxin system HipA family toxin [Gammaproteobacteria bacterium]|nr:type II toxin-antitoxin system HipA family toxin [Gammaproteobacteria bacterium]
MKYKPVTEIKVGLDFGKHKMSVGRLASRQHQIYFEYDALFLKSHLALSPLHLPLEPGLKTFDRSLFEGLPGLLNDSLPDGWGRLLLDRALRLKGVLPGELTPLDRLSHVGMAGMGALTYEPYHNDEKNIDNLDLDDLASDAAQVLSGEADDVLQTLLALNGSSAGARPKALIGVDKNKKKMIHNAHVMPKTYTHWLVKFPNAQDGLDAGAIEYVYSLMARLAGLNMTESYLFPAKKSSGYFATKRFDRIQEQRPHVHTACGLLHSDFRTPSLDYMDLLALTEMLTRDVREVEKMFRQAVFNVLSHNRDDHAKNFSFLMDEPGEWTLSPAYDLTFSSGPGGEQSTMVLGKGRDITHQDLIQLGLRAKLDNKIIHSIIDQTRHALSQWTQLAKHHGVSQRNITMIASLIGDLSLP